MNKKEKFALVMVVLVFVMVGCGRKSKDEAKKDGYNSTEYSSNTSDTYDTGVEYSTSADDSDTTYDSGSATDSDYTTNSYDVETDIKEDIYYSGSGEEYNSYAENGFVAVSKEPLSTFSADVDTASYSNLRRMIKEGYIYDEDAIRVEEMLNYFNYDYEGPTGREPFGVNVEIGKCPWNPNTSLMMVGMQTKNIDFSEGPNSNLVFLLDVSGSMNDPDKLPLMQQAFCMLAENLTRKDRVSIVVYAGEDAVILEGAKGNETNRIIEKITSLEAGGSTAGSAGIQAAYELAERYFIKGGNNRVILATDGDLNVGLTTEYELTELITKKRDSGIYLSVLGFGTGNIKDNNMEALADNGNGNYAYIDSVYEAKKVLVDELGANMVTVAKDVKFQVEFNPEQIKGYRLIGYENRVLATEDFKDDAKDAGEIGAGHSVTALYELVPVSSNMELDEKVTGSRYSSVDEKYKDELLTIKVRYKEPDKEESKLLTYPVTTRAYTNKTSDDWNFATCIAEFAMILKDSPYLENGSMNHLRKRLNRIEFDDGYKKEFKQLVNKVAEWNYYE
ncbi:Ca-activated chloride channel family protein [Anaerosporobacter mobilis DSM 15930]|uniref:Ca-activated chloride channel family protein n=1 Tax=Anaerosporobacter mobilis DSM 15930 TaxID=1120996 RepID=A0A1M7KAY0_9FIRM|nr:VWA domain-containing protein [Anaerosporobacter mobilis]SHM62388.1 Ca-activated chloride channel family protein [Anaerosporobacter mobilis DSM 15930]